MTVAIERDPRRDLLLERLIDVPPELVWAAWTEPQHVKQWFTPAPWKTVDCEIDLRPGGIFRTVMRSPEGQDINNVGCILEVIRNRKLVWTRGAAAGLPALRTDLRRSDLHRRHPDGASREGHQIQRPRAPQGRGEPQHARPDGVQRGLGKGARSARRPRQDDVAHRPLRSATRSKPLPLTRSGMNRCGSRRRRSATEAIPRSSRVAPIRSFPARRIASCSGLPRMMPPPRFSDGRPRRNSGAWWP